MVGAALVRGTAVRGGPRASSPGSPLDLAPPADHIAGRWALALVLVGYVAGRVRQETPWQSNPSATSVVRRGRGVVSFVGTSIFALGGLMLQRSA